MALIYLRLLVATSTFAHISLSQRSMEGKVQTLKCVTTKVVNIPQINWQIQNELKNVSLFQCTTYFLKCDPFDDTFLELYSATITQNSSSYISVMTIKNVSLSLHNKRYFCSADNQESVHVTTTFDLQVFAAAESPTCDKVALLNASSIQINCGTKQVFPESMCLFTVKTNDSSEYELTQGYISYKQEQNRTTQYYKTTCTLVVSVAILGPGTHMFRVVMCPNIKSNITEEMKSRSEYTSSISLGFPRAALASDCQVNNYIRENGNRTCTCYDNQTHFLPTFIIWSSNEKLTISNSNLEFKASRPSSNQENFKCTVSNNLNWSDYISYQPNVAYGPDSVNLVINKQENIICDKETLYIEGNCQVSDSNPLPTVVIIANDSSKQLKPGTEKNEYRFNISVSSAGVLNVSCVAFNSVFGDISSKTSLYSYIKGSHKSPNITSITNSVKIIPSNNVMSVYEGMTTVICEAEREYPFNMNITFTCGSFQRSETSEKVVVLILNVSKEIGNINCSCEVTTESRCPKKTIHVILQISKDVVNVDREINAVAIGIGVAAGLVILMLFAVILLFIKRQKKSKHVHTSGAKISEDYSNLQATHFPEKIDHYEMPTLKPTISSQDKHLTIATITNRSQNIDIAPKNELGGFIVTEVSSSKENKLDSNELIENTPKQDKHLYQEVTDEIEFADAELMTKIGNRCYLNVKDTNEN